VRLVAHRMAQSRRRRDRAALPELKRLVRLDRERHTAIVEAVEPLGDEARKEIRTGLAHIYGPGLETVFLRTPALIGGLRITVGSDVYDGSVQASLEAIEARLGA
jgi:F-type H+-transporting ATPase subunit delta